MNPYRPQHLADVVGQARVRENLAILLDSAQTRAALLPHILFYGPPGTGKTTLAHLCAREMGAGLKSATGPAIEKGKDLAALLANLNGGDVLFIDEIHRLPLPVEEILYPALEDYKLDIVIGSGPGARTVSVPLPRFTLIGATTRLALLSKPLQTRFGALYRLALYSVAELTRIVEQAADQAGIASTAAGREEIARRARGTPRIALRLLERARDYAVARSAGTVTATVAVAAMDLLAIDALGLEALDREVLYAIIGKYGGGPVGLKTLAASVGEPDDTLVEVVEPYLLYLGFLERTPRGRLATPAAYAHLAMPLPDDLTARQAEAVAEPEPALATTTRDTW